MATRMELGRQRMDTLSQAKFVNAQFFKEMATEPKAKAIF
jgi:hypothetical protein